MMKDSLLFKHTGEMISDIVFRCWSKQPDTMRYPVPTDLDKYIKHPGTAASIYACLGDSLSAECITYERAVGASAHSSHC